MPEPSPCQDMSRHIGSEEHTSAHLCEVFERECKPLMDNQPLGFLELDVYTVRLKIEPKFE
jgi:hypothetical protein